MTTRVYLSGVASRTHLLYAGSYLRHLLATQSGDVVLVNLGLRPFLGEHRVGDDDLRTLLPQDPRLSSSSDVDPRPGERLVYLAVGAPGIKPYLRLRGRRPWRRLRVVVVDEGLGSYGDWRSRRDAWLREGVPAWWATTRALVVHGARRLLTDERWSLYRCVGGTWEVRAEVAAELGGAPLGHLEGARPPYAVLLSQPLVELGLVPRERWDAVLREVAAACASAGLDLVVRAHPAEAPRAGVVTSRTPAERDPLVRGAAVCLGTASTALLNLAALRLVPTVRLDLPEVRTSEGSLAPAQRALLETFLPAGTPLDRLADALGRHAGGAPR